MEVKISMRTIGIVLTIIIAIPLLYFIYQQVKPVKTIYIKGKPFSFREDIRRAFRVEIFPEEYVLAEAFQDFKIRNVTILFKPGSPETNALYQLETFEITYKLSRYDDLTRGFLRPKKTFNADTIETYDNITRENKVLKIILIPPEFSNETKIISGGNRIWIYGKTQKDFDLATEKAILSMMNVTSLEGYV